MFGRRNTSPNHMAQTIEPKAADSAHAARAQAESPVKEKVPVEASHTYFSIKTIILNALIDSIDIVQLDSLDIATAREELRDVANEIFAVKIQKHPIK